MTMRCRATSAVAQCPGCSWTQLSLENPIETLKYLLNYGKYKAAYLNYSEFPKRPAAMSSPESIPMKVRYTPSARLAALLRDIPSPCMSQAHWGRHL
jgi:hypothetical protein